MHIPNNEGNAHWQEFLEWCDGGNTPDPMDIVPTDEIVLIPSLFVDPNEPVRSSAEVSEDLKLIELTQYYYAKMAEGFVYLDETFDIDERALNNISTELMFQVQDFEPFPKKFSWRGYENQDVPMKQEEFVEFARQARQNSNN